MEPRQKREIERSVGDVADRMRELVNIQHERRLAELAPKPREDLALELLTEMEAEELENNDRNMEIVNAGISAIAGLVGVLVGAWLSVG